MDDVISRQQAIDALNKLSESTYEVNYGVVDCDDAINAIVALLSTEPKRGKWIRDGHHIRCDQCEMCMCDIDREGDKIPNKFCPNCGSYNGGKINDQ